MARLFALLVAAAAISLPALADHRPVLLSDGTIVHGDWGLHRPGHIVPYVEWSGAYVYSPAPHGYYFPTNKNDPFAYRSRATKAPSVPGPRYRRTWGAESYLAPDINQVPLLQGPYVIPAPIIVPGKK